VTPLGPAWEELFDSFEHTAYRLEVRERYNARLDQLEVFVRHGRVSTDWLEGWLDEVRTAARQGRTYKRVRVVDVPLSDYSRFSLWLATYNNEAGEDIRYLARPDAVRLALPTFDYWMFDSRTVAKMHFDDDDTLLGFELIEDPTAVVDLNHARDVAWHHAVTREDFAAKHFDER
jgi:hypothetical protein